MTNPFQRPTDPLATEPLPRNYLDHVWDWLREKAAYADLDYTILSGIAALAAGIDRERAVAENNLLEAKRARAEADELRKRLAEIERDEDEKDRAAVTIHRVFPRPRPEST